MKKHKMKLNRNYRLASTLGHIIVFKKDQETEVPDIMVRQAVDIGAVFCDDAARDEVYKEPEGPPATPVVPAERQDAILAAIDAIEAGNDREDFTATGNPKLKSIEREAGFKIDKGELVQAMKTRNEDQ